MSIGSIIKELREERGLRQEDVADRLNMNRANFSHYERGTATPPCDVLCKIADVFNVTTDYILGRESIDIVDDNIRSIVIGYKALAADDQFLINEVIKMMLKRRNSSSAMVRE